MCLLVELIICQSEAEILNDPPQFMLLNLSIPVVIKQPQCFHHTLQLASHLVQTIKQQLGLVYMLRFTR